MGHRKNKSNASGSLFGAFRSASDSNLASNPPTAGASIPPNSGPQSGQISVEQTPQQAALSPPTPTPTPTPGRIRRFFRGLASPPRNVTGTASQSLAVPLPRPHSSHSEPAARKTHGLLATGGDVTAVNPVSSLDHGSSSSPDVQGSPLASPLSAPVSTPIIREPIATDSPAPIIKADVCAVEPPTDPASTERCPSPATSRNSAPVARVSSEPIVIDSPVQVKIDGTARLPTDPTPIVPPPSSAVWAKTLELAQEKLSENKLPPLDLTNLALRENIEAVVKSLNDLQEDEQRKRWRYTWRGKEIIIAERLGEILRTVQKYSGIVGTAVQCDPQVSALVWAGVQGIMQVSIYLFIETTDTDSMGRSL